MSVIFVVSVFSTKVSAQAAPLKGKPMQTRLTTSCNTYNTAAEDVGEVWAKTLGGLVESLATWKFQILNLMSSKIKKGSKTWTSTLRL